jgi:hypothetical protein
MVDIDLRERIGFEVFGTNDLVGFILNRFFKAICANGVGTLETVRKVEGRAKPIGANSAFELIDMENFHILLIY